MAVPTSRKLFLATLISTMLIAALVAVVALLLRSSHAGEDDPLAAVVVVALFASLAAFAGLRFLFDFYVRAPLQLAEEARIAIGDSRRRVGLVGPRELQEVARAINDLAARREALEDDVAA